MGVRPLGLVARLATIAIFAIARSRPVAIRRCALEQTSRKQSERERPADEYGWLPPRKPLRIVDEFANVFLPQVLRYAIDLPEDLLDIARDRVVLLIAQRLRRLPDGVRDSSDTVESAIFLRTEACVRLVANLLSYPVSRRRL